MQKAFMSSDDLCTFAALHPDLDIFLTIFS